MIWQQNEEPVSCCKRKLTCTVHLKNVSHLSQRTREALDTPVARLPVGNATQVNTWIKVAFLVGTRSWVGKITIGTNLKFVYCGGWIMFEKFGRPGLYFA
jgi:hypothetical protein